MRTDIYTYFTSPNGQSELLYSGESWVRIFLFLETAGPVSVGTRESVTPVLSGKGILIPSDGRQLEFVIPKGNRIFIAAESINRVKFIVEPIPWQEQILYEVSNTGAAIKSVLASLLSRPSGPSKTITRTKTPVKPTGKRGLDCPPPLTIPNFFKGTR
jgi:hypothetical protein